MRTEGLKFMTRLLYGNDSGWFERKHMHLRHIRAHDLEIQACLEKWAGMDKEKKCLMKILCCGGCLYRDLLKCDSILSKCYDAFGHDDFCRIMCGSFACRIETPGFLDKLHDIQVAVGPDDFRRMMCDSFFCRFEKEGFLDKLHDIQVVVGPDDFRRMMCGSFFCRLETPGFLEKL
jgi:hypothetical protein